MPSINLTEPLTSPFPVDEFMVRMRLLGHILSARSGTQAGIDAGAGKGAGMRMDGRTNAGLVL